MREADAIMAAVLDLEMQCGLSRPLGFIWDCKFMFSHHQTETHKAPSLSVRHLLLTIEEPAGKGCRADGYQNFFCSFPNGIPNRIKSYRACLGAAWQCGRFHCEVRDQD